jgi:hypothetical protein
MAGHRFFARVTVTLLNPNAETQTTDLLGPGTTVAGISTWADDIHPSRRNASPWHAEVHQPLHAVGAGALVLCASLPTNAAMKKEKGDMEKGIVADMRILQDSPGMLDWVREQAKRVINAAAYKNLGLGTYILSSAVPSEPYVRSADDPANLYWIDAFYRMGQQGLLSADDWTLAQAAMQAQYAAPQQDMIRGGGDLGR